MVPVETMLEWAKSMTWKGIKPVVKLSKTVYQKDIPLSKKAMLAPTQALSGRKVKLISTDVVPRVGEWIETNTNAGWFRCTV